MKSTIGSTNFRYAVIPEWILLHPKLTANAIRVFGVIDRYVGQNEYAWPSHKSIGQRIGVSRETVKRAINELIVVGAISVVERRRDDGSQTSSAYYIWPKSETLGAKADHEWLYNDSTHRSRLTQGGVTGDPGGGQERPRGGSRMTQGGVTDDLPRRSIIEETTSKEQQGTKATASPEVMGLIELLQLRLLEQGLEPFEETSRQYSGFKSLITKYGVEDVTDLLEWSTDHEFWKTVILTPLTLKKNWNTIVAQKKRDKKTQIIDWVLTPEEEDPKW